MGARSTEEVRRELESERERLGQAASALRTQAGTVRRKLPLVALGVGGAGLALRLVTKLVARRRR